MDNPDQSDPVEIEIARLRAVLVDESSAPLGMVSRLQVAVEREAGEGAPLGWEPRIVVACLVYAIISTVMPATPSGGFAPIVAAIALGYVYFVSPALRPARE